VAGRDSGLKIKNNSISGGLQRPRYLVLVMRRNKQVCDAHELIC
jgi:hypothetical protein